MWGCTWVSAWIILEEDDLRIERLKKKLGIRSKVDVLRAGIELLEKEAERKGKIEGGNAPLLWSPGLVAGK